jgi:hypothetical protein
MKSGKRKKIDVTLLPSGIMHIHLKEQTEITLNDAGLAVVKMGEISKRKKLPVFIDVGEFYTIDREVRVFSASKERNVYTIADAIAYASPGQKLVANFYLKQNNPSVPTKVFSEKKAVKLLKKF